MKIVIVSTYYSIGMGYTENCLARTLAAMGIEVHLIASNYNVYGCDPDYDENYRSFLGPADQGVGSFECDGYTVHRLPSVKIGGYLLLKGLAKKIRSIDPDVVHSIEIASLQTFVLAIIKPFSRYKLFTESHQHLSVVKPFLKEQGFHPVLKTLYYLTRTLPTKLASFAVEKCYAISPDCLYVANRFYGVPSRKLVLQSLGSDTQLFHPVETDDDHRQRRDLRLELGYGEDDIVCVYTGRFTEAKNPLVLAQAIDKLAKLDGRWHGLFVGEGGQREEILACANTKTVPFMTHKKLAQIYRASDIAVWPRQESMSMLDAASVGLPLVASHVMGEGERVNGNGKTYFENDVDDLVKVLKEFSAKDDRISLGVYGRKKMVEKFSWQLQAKSIFGDYQNVLG